MAWSTPLTAVANSALTAAQWNASVRDNLLETTPAKATAAGQMFIASGANSVVARTPTGAQVQVSESTTSTSYTNLTTPGPAVTVTTGTQAIISINSKIANGTATAESLASFAVSGATTIASSDNWCISIQVNGNQVRQGATILQTGLTAGSNTFTMQYRVTAGTGTFDRRVMVAIPL